MNSSKNKPSLEDLFISKKLSSPRPESWSDFEKKVKIKTLDSFHRQSSTRYAKYILPLVILSIVPIFIYDLDFLFLHHLPLRLLQAMQTLPSRVRMQKQMIFLLF
jgi:hypothetical protein